MKATVFDKHGFFFLNLFFACRVPEVPYITVEAVKHHAETSVSELSQNLHSAYIRWSPLQWRHNEHDAISNHQPHNCLLNCLFRCRSKKTSKLRVSGLCEGYSPLTGEFPTQRASNVENVSIWWRHHAYSLLSPVVVSSVDLIEMIWQNRI